MKNKLIPAMAIGAAVGAVVAMLDKNTRQSMKHQATNVNQLRKNPEPAKDKLMNLKDEVMYWKDQLEELRRNNPELEKAVMDAKDMIMDMRKK